MCRSASRSTSTLNFGDHEHGFDTIAEIPGTDPKLKDQVVMVGGHLDRWIAGTGATDNGAGTIVAMEAVRILKALDSNRGVPSALPLDRRRAGHLWFARLRDAALRLRPRSRPLLTKWTARLHAAARGPLESSPNSR